MAPCLSCLHEPYEKTWSILVAANMFLRKKSLVQIFEAPLARFTRISQESFEEEIEVPSTSRAIDGLKMLGLLVVGPQHCLEARQHPSERSQSL